MLSAFWVTNELQFFTVALLSIVSVLYGRFRAAAEN
jgi:hypothetical protein